MAKASPRTSSHSPGRFRKLLHLTKFFLTLGLFAGNLWLLLKHAAPLAITHLGGWMPAERWWQVCGIGLGLMLVLPPFWASRRYRRVAGWLGGLSSLVLIFNAAVLTGLSYSAAMAPPQRETWRAERQPPEGPVAIGTMPTSDPVDSPLSASPDPVLATPASTPTPDPFPNTPASSPTPDPFLTPPASTPDPFPATPAPTPTASTRVASQNPASRQNPASIPGSRPITASSSRYPRSTRTDWSAIDAHALAAPREVESRVDSLAAYLTEGLTDDRDKLRAMYRWITDRIAYDTEAFFSDRLPDGSPETTLRRRKAVCDGNSRLMQALVEAAGMEGEIVIGYARGIEWPGHAQDRENHAWNAVKLYGEWKLLDATWGAGQVGDDKNFQKEFRDFFFLTPPERLLNTHRPKDDRWQLRSPALSWEDFQAQPRLSEDFYTLGLSLAGRSKMDLQANPHAVVELTAPDSLYVGAELTDSKGKEIPGASVVYREGRVVRVHVKAPRPGNYEFQIFAAPLRDMQDTKLKMKGVAEFRVRSQRGDETGYPRLTVSWDLHGGRLTAPLQGKLRPGKQHFELEIPGARAVFLNDWDNALKRDGQRFSGDLNLSAGKAEVYAQFTDNRAEAIAVYEVVP